MLHPAVKVRFGEPVTKVEEEDLTAKIVRVDVAAEVAVVVQVVRAATTTPREERQGAQVSREISKN